MKGEPILITGAGIVSSIGFGKQETLDSLLAGKSGIGRMRYLQSSHTEFPVGEVQKSNEELREMLDLPESKPMVRTALMGAVALKEALEEARLAKEDLNKVVFLSGTTVGGMDKSEQYYQDFLNGDSHKDYIATHDCGACSELTADIFGNFGYIGTPSTACSSAANSIIVGAEMIRCGLADIVVAGGSEALTLFHLNGFNALMILDQEPCRPFDATRSGLNLGEGAAYIVIERESSAKRRGVRAVAELKGYGNACDAYHQTASSPDGEGSYLAMKKAVVSSGIDPSEVDYINAHGTGTPNNDVSESSAMFRLFGENMPPVSSTKSFTGHTTSASGAIETVICLLALRNQFLPKNLNWKNQMEDGITPVTCGTPQREIRNVICNSFGFGGNDSSLVISKWSE